MAALLSIGDFSRATHLTVKALRHYDDVGLLVPADVDAATGYRRYRAAQVPTAHLIRRLRDLDMPLPGIQAVMQAASAADRDAAISDHLQRMEQALDKTRLAVTGLRALLDRSDSPIDIEHRDLPRTLAAAVTADVAWDEAETWLTQSLAIIHESVDTTQACGPDSALYAPAFFHDHVGHVTAFVAVSSRSDLVTTGLAAIIDVPAMSCAFAVHRGPFDRLDETYGELGAYVSANLLGTEGPIREHYLDEDTTEIGWPIARS
jgi:DNA-binding transcriptional MerR regulator